MDLTTLSSLRACRTLKTVVRGRSTLSSLRACRTLETVVKCKFLGSPSDPFVTSDVSDAQNCGKTQIFELASDPFIISDVSDAQNCGKVQILDVAEQPFRHFGRVGSSKLW